ncbi:hypothetical protein EU527_19285, partial [Candidatus Thorarchaeota archaeon]
MNDSPASSTSGNICIRLVHMLALCAFELGQQGHISSNLYIGSNLYSDLGFNARGSIMMEYYRPKTPSPALYVTLLAILTSLTTIATIIIAIPFPTTSGFLNFGDTMVLLSGLILGPLGGFIAGGF